MKSQDRPSGCTWLKMSISAWQSRWQHSYCGRNFMPFMRRNPPRWNSYWSDSCSIWRWQRRIWRPPTSKPSTGCCPNSPPKGLTSKKKLKPLLALLLSLPASWEVFCTTFTKNYLNLNLDVAIGQVMTEDIWWWSMGLTTDDSVEAHYSTEEIGRIGQSTSRSKRRDDWLWSKSRSSQSNAFYTHCRKASHNISDCCSIKRKENGWRFDRTQG